MKVLKNEEELRALVAALFKLGQGTVEEPANFFHLFIQSYGMSYREDTKEELI